MKTVYACFDDVGAALQAVDVLYDGGAASEGVSLLVLDDLAQKYILARRESAQAKRLAELMGFGITSTQDAGPLLAAGPVMRALRKAEQSVDGALQAWGLGPEDRFEALAAVKKGQTLLLAGGKSKNVAMMSEQLRTNGAEWVQSCHTPPELFAGTRVVEKSALHGDEDTPYYPAPLHAEADTPRGRTPLHGEEDTPLQPPEQG